MQRQIKFRAWNSSKAVEAMLDWSYIKQVPLQQMTGRDYLHLMQYTGLKDKNGKEIYEGDIVRDIDAYLNDSGVWTNDVGEVYYSAPSFGVAAHTRNLNAHEQFEVIGNIYSNPELLGGSHDS